MRRGPLGQRIDAAGTADAADQVAKRAPLAEQHFQGPGGLGRDIPGIAQRQLRRDGQPIARIAAAFADDLQIEREHQRRALCGGRAVDQLLIEAAISHQVLLKPEGFLRGLAHILDRADGHGAQAKRNAAGSGGPCAQYFAVGVKQSREAGGSDRERHGHRRAEKRRGKRNL